MFTIKSIREKGDSGMFKRENKFNNNLESDNCLLNTMKPNIS